MTDSDDPAHRLHYRATGDDIHVRDAEDVEGEDDVFEVRMPIATTGQVRNDNDEPLTRGELDGMARQLAEREIGVFPAHGGDGMIANGRYSPFEKLGTWQDATVDSRDSEDVLMATARMPDPETLPAATGDYREALAILKEQATRGIAQDASIAWRDDEDFRGGVDLMEASIVGIGADWRTNTGDEQAEVVARAAVDAGVDGEALVAAVREAVDAEATDDMSDDDTPDEGTTDGAQDAPDDGDEQTERTTDEEFREFMREQQETQTELLRTLTDAIREDDDDEEDEDDETDEENEDDDEEDDDDEQAADEPDTEQDVLERLAELEEAVDGLRSGDVDVDTPEPDDEQDADADDESDDGETTRDTAESPTDGLGDFR